MHQGFSLVELSIVLVILGLLTGGILTGQSLIRASELRAVTKEYQRYIAATHTFRDKYFALPGDMTNATNFWGTVGDSNGSTCTTGNGTTANMGVGTETCNGNGDGFLGTRLQTAEAFRYWQHLANAGLIEGRYAGVGASGAGDGLLADPSFSGGAPIFPQSKLSSQAYWAIWAEAGHTNTFYSSTNKYLYKNAYMIDQLNYTSPERGIMHRVTGVLRPEEAWNIDTKMDDGKPAYGKVHAGLNNGAAVCSTSTTASTAEYNLGNTDIECGLYFITDF